MLKIKSTKSVLLPISKTLTDILDSNSINFILSSIRIKTTNEEVVFTSSTQIISIEKTIKNTNKGIIVEENGEILIKAKTLYDIISKINDDCDIFLEQVDNTVVKIKAKKFSANILNYEISSYPIIDFSTDNAKTVEIDSKYISELNSKIKNFISKDTANISSLGNILLDTTRVQNKLEAVATDTAQLCCIESEFDVKEKIRILIPVQFLSLISGMINSNENKVKKVDFFVLQKYILCVIDDYCIKCALFDGEFPSINKLFDFKNLFNILVKKEELVNCIEKLIVINNSEKKIIIQIDINKDNLSFLCKNVGYGDSVDEMKLENTYEGEKISVLFDAKNMLNILKAIESKKVTITFSSKTKPFTFIDDQKTNIKFLLMPVRS